MGYPQGKHFPRDTHGNEIRPGDWVRSLYPYIHLKQGSLWRVMGTDNTCVHLQYKCYWRGNEYDENRFKGINFELVCPPLTSEPEKREAAPYTAINQPQTKESIMLHIAVRISGTGETRSLAEIVTDINHLDGNVKWLMADTSADTLKTRIRERIRTFPEERWLICSGNTIGESASPPVRFIPV